MEPLDGLPAQSVAPTVEPSAGSRPRGPAVRRLLAGRGVAIAALIAAVVTTARTHGFFIRPWATPMGYDEAHVVAVSQRLIMGHWLPYVDGVAHEGPVTYWLSALAMQVGGAFSWMPVRVLSLGLALATVTLVFLLGLELFSPFVAAVAVLVQTYLCNYELSPSDGVGYGGEVAAIPFLLLSALLVARMQNRPGEASGSGPSTSRTRWLVTAGALGGVAVLARQIALIHAAPAILWLVIGPRQNGGTEARRRDVARYLAGFALPFAAVLAVYLAAGHIREFLYYYQGYGRDIYMAPVTWTFIRDALRGEINRYSFGIAGASLVTLFAMARALEAVLSTSPGPASDGPFSFARAVARIRANCPILFVLLHFVGAVAGASLTFRFFGHYFLDVYPFLGLVAGYSVSASFDALDESHPWTVAGALLVVVGGTGLLALAGASQQRNVAWRRGIERWDKWYQDPESDPVVRYVEQTTDPSDTIFVWGYRSEIYVSAHRYPAARFVRSTYPSGFVPWFGDATRREEASRVVPGSQQLLMRDLEDSQPELVIDSGDSMLDRSMRDIPVFRHYLEEHYCLMGEVDAEPVYRRRRGDDCPEQDAP